MKHCIGFGLLLLTLAVTGCFHKTPKAQPSANWGNINGNIQQQTDLQDQMATKQGALTSYADIVKLWPNCIGFLKHDGTCVPMAAATDHFTTLTWDHPTGTQYYNVYKSLQPCATASAFERIAQVSAKNYHDHAVAPGETACYYVTAFDGSTESAPSSKAEGTTPTKRK